MRKEISPRIYDAESINNNPVMPYKNGVMQFVNIPVRIINGEVCTTKESEDKR